MSHDLIKASLATPALSDEVLRRPPAVVERSGRRAVEVWVDFFTAALANDNTRSAYKRGLHEFFRFVELQPDATLDQVTARMVAAWREWLTKGPALEQGPSGRSVERKRAIATVKLKMAAVRSFFAYLKERGVLSDDPAAGVKGRPGFR